MAVEFRTGVNFAEGQKILSPIIQEINTSVEAEVGLKDEATKLGITSGDVLTPEGKITSMVGPSYLVELDEDGEIPLSTNLQGWEKGYKMKAYGKRNKTSKEFVKWAQTATTIAGADSSVKEAIRDFASGVKNLMLESKRTLNREFTRILTDGFTATEANGPGSVGGDGKPLFANDHPVKAEPGVVYSNICTGALTAANLLSTIEKYKTQVKAPSGFNVDTPKMFTLLVPRALETTARVILNSGTNSSGMFAGTGSNANLLNVFNFEGSKVELVVLDLVGQKDGKGGIIGGANANSMWFLMNKEYALEYKAFRHFELYPEEIEVWTDPNTKTTYSDIMIHFGVDFYNPECIMGYAGA